MCSQVGYCEGCCLGCDVVLRAGTGCSETGQIHISNGIVVKEEKDSRNVKNLCQITHSSQHSLLFC